MSAAAPSVKDSVLTWNWVDEMGVPRSRLSATGFSTEPLVFDCVVSLTEVPVSIEVPVSTSVSLTDCSWAVLVPCSWLDRRLDHAEPASAVYAAWSWLACCCARLLRSASSAGSEPATVGEYDCWAMAMIAAWFAYFA